MRFFLIFSIFLIITFISVESYAEEDVMGETYQITEVDFLQFIQSRIETIQKNGQWQRLQKHIQKTAIYYRDRPKKVDGLLKATTTRSFKFDPSIKLDHDVLTDDGKVIAKAGTRFNPLETISLTKALIFYDGDDKDQVKWALEEDKKLQGKVKLILVNGSGLKNEKKIQKEIYFDQAGTLTTRFSIKHIPAIDRQDGMVLKITEVAI